MSTAFIERNTGVALTINKGVDGKTQQQGSSLLQLLTLDAKTNL